MTPRKSRWAVPVWALLLAMPVGSAPGGELTIFRITPATGGAALFARSGSRRVWRLAVSAFFLPPEGAMPQRRSREVTVATKAAPSGCLAENPSTRSCPATPASIDSAIPGIGVATWVDPGSDSAGVLAGIGVTGVPHPPGELETSPLLADSLAGPGALLLGGGSDVDRSWANRSPAGGTSSDHLRPITRQR